VSVKDVVYQNSLDISLDSLLEYQQPVAVSPHASGYYTSERFIVDICSRDVILELRSVRWELSAQVRSTVERAGCGGTCRGLRAGKHVAASPKVKPATGKSQPCQQPVVVVATRRRAVSVSAIVIAEMSTNKTTR